MVLPYINMNPPQVYTCSPSWTAPPCNLPPRTIHLGYPSAPAPSILYHALNLDWWFISYLILYMFQCHSPKSSHPLPLLQSPKDCSIQLCLFCCLTYRVIATITEFHIVSNMLDCLLNWPPLPFYVLKDIFGQRWKFQLLILSVRWLWWDILAHCSHSLVWKLKGRIFTCNNRNIE